MRTPDTFRLSTRILVHGYGNPARGDDGLGPLFVERFRELAPPNVTLDSDYQLVIEDAAAAAEHDAVILVDAAIEGPEPYEFRSITAQPGVSFSTHSVSPEGLMHLAREVGGKDVPGWILAIRGYDFEPFTETISLKALENLEAALTFFKERLVE